MEFSRRMGRELLEAGRVNDWTRPDDWPACSLDWDSLECRTVYEAMIRWLSFSSFTCSRAGLSCRRLFRQTTESILVKHRAAFVRVHGRHRTSVPSVVIGVQGCCDSGPKRGPDVSADSTLNLKRRCTCLKNGTQHPMHERHLILSLYGTPAGPPTL
ncbi:hypothetical protein N656DRAFT_40904 [Canariomyces notabilis]|uniref:Uncharacterized protein n=1 Tax=Canariomyces notabilis TaxID=2074819 RepID=A0AAN6TN48_9PEZI|nr:hypothetical protein N656DRAFT_40904 [Canariomyces arenarius]